MFAFLLPPKDYELPLAPSWLESVTAIYCLTTILLPKGAIRLSSGVVVFGVFFYVVFWTKAVRSRGSYVNGINLCSYLFRWLDLIAIHHPEKDFWKTNQSAVKEDDGKVSRADVSPGHIWAKLRWFGGLWISGRAIGWNIQSRSIPATLPEDYPTRNWIVRKSIRTGIMVIGSYLDSRILDFYTKDVLHSNFFAQPMLWQVLVSWIYAYRTYFQLEAMYNTCAVISVSIGICHPRDWPPMMGSFRRDAYTIRKMWGMCWHQLMRRQCSEAGRIVTDLFGFKKGAFMSKYSQLWVGFLVSATAHHIGGVHGAYGKERCYNQFLYFMIQPAGIMFEDFVIFWSKKLGSKESVWTKGIGFLWVIIWFSITMRYIVEASYTTWILN